MIEKGMQSSEMCARAQVYAGAAHVAGARARAGAAAAHAAQHDEQAAQGAGRPPPGRYAFILITSAFTFICGNNILIRVRFGYRYSHFLTFSVISHGCNCFSKCFITCLVSFLENTT
jgi:hypothetical protein